MSAEFIFHTDTEFAGALKALFEQLDRRIELKSPVTAYIAGGVAIHLYTGYRPSGDVDAEFSARLYLPQDLGIEVQDRHGRPTMLHFDTNYNSSFALMHEDYRKDSWLVTTIGHFDLRVLSPVDLVVSKIARLSDHDKEDIEQMVRHGLTNARAIEERAKASLVNYVGNVRMLELNIRDVLVLARNTQEQIGKAPVRPIL